VRCQRRSTRHYQPYLAAQPLLDLAKDQPVEERRSLRRMNIILGAGLHVFRCCSHSATDNVLLEAFCPFPEHKTLAS
jgi:hypothetical protein